MKRLDQIKSAADLRSMSFQELQELAAEIRSYLLVALFSRYYWIVGSVLGGILGQIVPFDLTGLDFCMTALFLIIFIDQWEKAEKHTLALSPL